RLTPSYQAPEDTDQSLTRRVRPSCLTRRRGNRKPTERQFTASDSCDCSPSSLRAPPLPPPRFSPRSSQPHHDAPFYSRMPAESSRPLVPAETATSFS